MNKTHSWKEEKNVASNNLKLNFRYGYSIGPACICIYHTCGTVGEAENHCSSCGSNCIVNTKGPLLGMVAIHRTPYIFITERKAFSHWTR